MPWTDVWAWNDVGLEKGGTYNISGADQRGCTGKNTVNLTINESGDGDDMKCISAEGSVAIGADVTSAKLATVVGSWASASAEGAVAIGNGANASSSNSVVIGRNAWTDKNAIQAVVIGQGASAVGNGGRTDEENAMIAIGKGARARGNQATVVGSTAAARRQATAIGNDVFAQGSSSIAIGNDDIVNANYQDKLPVETIRRIFSGLWTAEGAGDMNAALISYGNQKDSESFYYKYIESENKDTNGSWLGTTTDKRNFSPTYAAGLGSIAIGSRTVAGGELSTSVGSLSFALADRSTAVGLRAFVAGPGTINQQKFDGAVGATAIGENSRVFAANSVAIGNNAEASHTGAYAYGYNAKAVGAGSIALGYSTVAGARINADQYDKLKTLTSYLHGLTIIDENGKVVNSNVNTFNIGINALINGGQINGQDVTGVQAGFTDNALFEQKGTDGLKPQEQRANEYLEVNGKKIYNLQLGDGDGIEPNGKNDYSANNGIAIGRYAFALRQNSITMGYGTISDAQSGIAIGSYAHVAAGSTNSVALGVNAYVTASNALALGYSSKALGGNSSAIGVGSNATAQNAIAFGLAAQATSAGSMAFGNLARATLENSMALGYQSRTDYTTTDASNKPTGTAWDALSYEERNKYLSDFNKYAWMPDGKDSIYYISNQKAGIISVGQKLSERRITNLAPGALGSDAVNVDQLRSVYYQLQSDLSKSNRQNTLHYLSVSDKGQNTTLENSMNLVENYQDYVTKKAMYLSYVARKKLNNENFSQSAMDEMKADILKMEADNSTFKDTATALKNFDLDGNSFSASDSISTVLNNLNNAQDSDFGKTPPGTADIEAERNASNYDNNKAIAADSIAIGYRASTGETATGGITIGTRATVSGVGGVALGQNASVTGNKSIAVGFSSSATGTDAIAVGDTAQATGDNNALAIGKGALASGTWHSVAIGQSTKASADNALALGSNSFAGASKAIAIGADNNKNGDTEYTVGEQSIAIGNGNRVSGAQSIAIGTGHNVSGANSGAFGDPNTVSGTGSYAFGNNNTVTADYTFVLGNNVTAAQARSVYLGGGVDFISDTTKSKGLATYTATDEINGATFSNFAGATPVGIVTIGKDSESRRLQGVAPGLLSANSTDAINGSQLYSVLNQGLSLKGNFNSAGAMTTYQSMGMKFDLVSGTDAKWTGDSVRYLGNNLATYIDGGNKRVLFGMRKDPTFESMILRNPEDTTNANGIKFAATANTVTLKQVLSTGADVASGTTNTVKLTNLTNATISGTSSDAVTGAQLNAIKNIIGGNDYTITNGIVAAPAVSNGAGGVANTGKTTIDAAIKASQEKVIAKTSQNELVTVTVANEKTADGANQYEVGLNVTNLAKELAKPENGGFAKTDLSNITTDGKKAVSGLVSATAKDGYTSVDKTDNADGTRAFTIGTNVATTITNEAAATTGGNANKVASAQAVYSAVSGAKADINLTTDDTNIFSLTGDKTAGLGSDTFTLAFSKAKLLEVLKGNGALDDTFVKVDGSNLPDITKEADATKVATWRTKLGIGDGVNWFNVNPQDSAKALNYDKSTSGAKGTNAIAIGYNVSAPGNEMIAIGSNITAKIDETDPLQGQTIIAIGRQAGSGRTAGEHPTIGGGSVLLGANTYSDGVGGVAIGTSAGAAQQFGTAVGSRAEAKGINATAVGANAKAEERQSLALGSGSKVETGSLAGSIALGATSVVSGAAVNGTSVSDYLIAGAKDKDGNDITTVAGQDASNAILAIGSGKDGATGSIKYRQIQNVAPGLVSKDSTDAINGSQLYYTNKTVTTLAEKIGNGSINGVDGARGENGAPGTSVAGQPGVPGNAGKDGLNGESLANKVQGLRDGMAGTVVYTDAETGERVLVENGKYYSAAAAGALVKANNGLWYEKDRVNDDGTLKDPNDNTGKTLAERVTAGNGKEYTDLSKIMLSAVNTAGDTKNDTTPITLSHIASALGIDPTSYKDSALTADTAAKDKTKVFELIGQTAQGTNSATGLYALSGSALNKAVTLADLQAIGLTGLVFGADNSITTPTLAKRVALGGTFNILGDGTGTSGANQYIDTTVSADGVRITLNQNAIDKLNAVPTSDNMDKKANTNANNIGEFKENWSKALQGITYTGDNDSATAEKKLGSSVSITGGKNAPAADQASSGNIVVTASDAATASNAEVLIQLASNLTGISSVAGGSDATKDAKLTFVKEKDADDKATTYDDTKPVILANDAILTGLADGKVETGSKDAVTGGQLADALAGKADTATSGIKFMGDTGSTESDVKLNKTLNVNGTKDFVTTKTAEAGTDGNGSLVIDLAQGVKDKLAKIDSSKDYVDTTRSIQLTADSGSTTAQTLANNVSFKVAGAEGIETSGDRSTITVKIANGGVTEAKLAKDAVTKDKIKDGAVDNAKLAADAVTTDKIKNKTILEEDLNDLLTNKINQGAAFDSAKIKLTGDNSSTSGDILLKNNPSLAFTGSSDIETKASATGVSFTLNKETTVTNAAPTKDLVVTSGAVYNAIKTAKPTVAASDATHGSMTDNLITVVGSKSDDISGNSFYVGLSKAALVNALKDDFAG
ncbi:hypothetical protein QV08_00355 [Gallibacterium salpingitidis]|uniref:hypothetical protein n=1 Tax=Gallibacterium salpingitidis TaxID=505341 RepID=UPI000805D3BF|nr:hypothetical protein [Gallibacterium salpingitidis]OBX10024.1 hypothetical protein QV08_00355 [Gallibacterium salpingitidis]WKS98889.1 hypothetical protein NYR30_09015 [Gallibacterium salpingitidis]